ncbi:MAG: reverse transcriptase/maturase family protein [Candidatus Ozemobacteraceae bacterium]
MKSFGGLWPKICSAETLHRAMLRAAQGKRARGPVVSFLADSDKELDFLRQELISGRYQPAPFIQFGVLDPKPRLISCASFRDRVVHHAVCDLIGPLLESSFIADSFACRIDKGAHRAVLRAQDLAGRYSFFAKLDIRRYFDSIDHDILLRILRPRFREKPLTDLLETIVRFPLPGQNQGKGIPIGNLTSQWFANTYLDGADHEANEYLRVDGYIRYMDDMVLFDSSQQRLCEAVGLLIEWLSANRKLEIKQEQLIIAPVRDGLPFLGWRIFPGMLRLQSARYLRSRRLIRSRERAFQIGRISGTQLAASVGAILASIRFLRPEFKFDTLGQMLQDV